MKTSARILLISLDLFNRHGEPNISSVDIANELDISPGNLYYHFKGKEIIIAALFDMYKQRMSKILLAPDEDNLSIEFFFFIFSYFWKLHTCFFFFIVIQQKFLKNIPMWQKDSSIYCLQNKKFFNTVCKLLCNRAHLLEINPSNKG